MILLGLTIKGSKLTSLIDLVALSGADLAAAKAVFKPFVVAIKAPNSVGSDVPSADRSTNCSELASKTTPTVEWPLCSKLINRMVLEMYE